MSINYSTVGKGGGIIELRTNHPLVAVGELVHEEVNSPGAKLMTTRGGKHRLEILVVDDTVAIVVDPVEGIDHLGVCAGRGEGCGVDVFKWVLHGRGWARRFLVGAI